MDDQEDYGLIKYDESFTGPTLDDHRAEDMMEEDDPSSSDKISVSSSQKPNMNKSHVKQWIVKGNRIHVGKLKFSDRRLVEQCFDIPLHEAMLNRQQTMMFIAQLIHFRHPTSLWHRCTEWEQHCSNMPEHWYVLWYNRDEQMRDETHQTSAHTMTEHDGLKPITSVVPWCERWREDLKQSLQSSMHAYHVDQIFAWYATDDLYVQQLLRKQTSDKHQTYLLQWIKDLLIKFNDADRFNVYHLLMTLFVWLTHPWTMGILRRHALLRRHHGNTTSSEGSIDHDVRDDHHDMSNSMLIQFWSHWFDPKTIDHLRTSLMMDVSTQTLSHYLIMFACIQSHVNQLGLHRIRFDTQIDAHVKPNMSSKAIKKLRFQVFVNSIINQMILPTCRQFIHYRCHDDGRAKAMHQPMMDMLDMLGGTSRAIITHANLQKMKFLGTAWMKRGNVDGDAEATPRGK